MHEVEIKNGLKEWYFGYVRCVKMDVKNVEEYLKEKE